MAIEILVVRRGAIWRGQSCEELRNEIYEHCAGCRPIWEGTQRISMSTSTDADLTLRLRWRTQPAADFGEKLALGRSETVDAAGVDLVEHAIDLGVGARVGIVARFGGSSGGRDRPAAADTRRLRHQHARFRRLPPTPLTARRSPVLALENEQRGPHTAKVGEVRDAVTHTEQRNHEIEPDQESDEPLGRNRIGQRKHEHRMIGPVPGERDGDAEHPTGGAEYLGGDHHGLRQCERRGPWWSPPRYSAPPVGCSASPSRSP